MWRGAVGDCNHGGGNSIGKGGGTDEKLANLANVWWNEKREDRDNANKRGERSPVRHSGNLDRGVMQG